MSPAAIRSSTCGRLWAAPALHSASCLQEDAVKSFLFFFIPISALVLNAETKKILVENADPGLVEELSRVSADARIVPVTKQNAMSEMGEPDAFIGNIPPQEVRADERVRIADLAH